MAGRLAGRQAGRQNSVKFKKGRCYIHRPTSGNEHHQLTIDTDQIT